jgi:hypothetical protein
MAYTTVSIPKFKTGAGAAAPKDPNVIFVRASDVLTMPSRDGVLSTSNIALKAGKKAVGVYLTPRSISRADSTDGEAADEMAGWIATVTGQRPGDDRHFAAWLQENVNEGMIIITKECGDAAGTRLHGTPCNPLYMAVEGQDNNEGIMSTLTYTQGQRSKYKTLHYAGTIPELAVDAVLVEGSSASGGI